MRLPQLCKLLAMNKIKCGLDNNEGLTSNSATIKNCCVKAIHAVNAVLWHRGEQTHISQTNRLLYPWPPTRASGNILLLFYIIPQTHLMFSWTFFWMCCSLFIHLHNGISTFLRKVPIIRYQHLSTTTHTFVVISTLQGGCTVPGFHLGLNVGGGRFGCP